MVTNGTGGDILPLVPIARSLERSGVDVVIACPPHLRIVPLMERLASVPMGGSFGRNRTREVLKLFEDGADGRVAVQTYWDQVVLRELPSAMRDLEPVVRPTDTVLSHQLAPAGRAAAELAGAEWLSFTFYPEAIAPAERPFAEGAQLSPTRTYLLCDPTLALAADGWDAVIAGYPYWDRPARWRPSPVVSAYLAAHRKFLLFTLGTSVGYQPGAFYEVAVGAAQAMGLPAVLVGDAFGRPTLLDDMTLATRFLPLSTIAANVVCVIHHGGIGTTHGAVGWGIPSVVVPRSYDQFGNARALSGLRGDPVLPWADLTIERMTDAIDRAMASPSDARRGLARSVAQRCRDASDLVASDLRSHLGLPR